MNQLKLPAVFMRGGTSRAIMFHESDLPEDRSSWDGIFMSAMGTPDPNGRQVDGMGGGVSSLSKVCIIGPPSRADADVDYTFVQIGVDRPLADYSSNCGNMSSAIGPFAIDEGLVALPDGDEAVVRIHNTNTSKIIVSRFAVSDGLARVAGDERIDGIAGSGAPIRLEFKDPGGAGTGNLLPTGHAVDTLDVPGVGQIQASFVDAANACVFVAADALDCSGVEMPQELEQNGALMERLEAVRLSASVAMGMAATLDEARKRATVPKVGMVSAPAAATTLSGRALAADDMDIAVRMISVGQPHRAVPLTGALCLASAVRVPGSIPHDLATPSEGRDIRIAQASGLTIVDARLAETTPDRNAFQIEYAAVYRTARRLFEGYVRCLPPTGVAA
jgi:2-methylaconitate cis-trans-isomerase PrpF